MLCTTPGTIGATFGRGISGLLRPRSEADDDQQIGP
jgi:hypothetical protein